MNNIIRPVKGTQDFYPEKMAVRSWLYNQVRSTSELFGYQEYEAPILEHLELYAAKSSEEIVERQSYVFTDRSGERITLRPELTPSLARMIATKQRQLLFPLRWWSFGPFWRYERPQKGRSREFFQWNIDQIGESSPEADAELIVLAATFLKNIGLRSGEFKIKINNRELIEKEIEKLEINNQIVPAIFQLIDKKDKTNKESWIAQLNKIGLSNIQVNQIENLLEDSHLWKNSITLSRIFNIVNELGLEEFVEFSPSIIRGLQYYTGTVFEAWDTQGDFRALFGGGRYNDLVGDVGGQPIGGVGFAVGDKVLTLLLEKLDRIPDLPKTPADLYFTLFNKDLLSSNLKISNKLRRTGINVIDHLKEEKLSKQLKFADRLGAKIALIMGPDELAKNEISIKNLLNGVQETVKVDDLAKKIHNILEE